MIDLHVHTSRCGHATGTVGQYVESARARGLSTVCFTDHLPLPPSYPAHYTMPACELTDYVADIRAAALASASSGGPEVLCGIEADWLPEGADHVVDALSAHGFDLVLGSVHFLGDWAFDDPDLIARYDAWDADVLWQRYFNELCRAAHSGVFDVIAHPDLVKKFGSKPVSNPGCWYDQAAEAMAGSGCAVEVNSAGLRKPVKEIYPALEFLAACSRRGVPATMGSDAHSPQEVGQGLSEARELLMAAGYTSVLRFRQRIAEEVAL